MEYYIMEITTFEMKKLTPSEGMVLTNGNAYSSPDGAVYLGANDTVENWKEITVEEYEARMAEAAETEAEAYGN